MNKLRFKGRYYALVCIDESHGWQRLTSYFGWHYWTSLAEIRKAIAQLKIQMNSVREKFPAAKAKYRIYKEVADKFIEEIHE